MLSWFEWNTLEHYTYYSISARFVLSIVYNLLELITLLTYTLAIVISSDGYNKLHKSYSEQSVLELNIRHKFLNYRYKAEYTKL